MNGRNLILIAAALAIATAVALGAYSLYRELVGGGSGPVAAIGGPFTLVDHTGERVSEADFSGKHMLVYFGYTYCPDVCPTELAVMSRALDLLGEAASEVTPVFITVDPARDTVETMADYRRHFHSSLVALTGSEEQIAAAAKAYRVYYAKAGEDDEYYLMDHTSFVYLMDEQGRYVAHFGPAVSAEAMAERIREAL